MNGDQPISWLMFFTLAAGVVIVGFAFINFIKSRSNRAVAADTLEGNGTGRGAAPDGALPELLGITDRIYVMSEGRIVGEMASAEASQEKIMRAIVRGEAKAAS